MNYFISIFPVETKPPPRKAIFFYPSPNLLYIPMIMMFLMFIRWINLPVFSISTIININETKNSPPYAIIDHIHYTKNQYIFNVFTHPRHPTHSLRGTVLHMRISSQWTQLSYLYLRESARTIYCLHHWNNRRGSQRHRIIFSDSTISIIKHRAKTNLCPEDRLANHQQQSGNLHP